MRDASIALVGLLHRPDYLPAALGVPHRLIEQVADDLVAVRRNANPLALFDQVEDQLSADRGLSRARRPLYGQIGLVEPRCQQLRDVLGSLTGLNQRGSLDYAVDPRRLEAEQIAGRPIRASPTKAIISSALAQSH